MFRRFFKDIHTIETMQLAWPLIITQVGHILTGMVDNIFLGRIGVTEQAAGILSNNLYVLLLVFTIGMSYASTPLVAAAVQKEDLAGKVSIFKNSLLLNFLVAIFCFVVLYQASGLISYLRQPASVVKLAVPFFDVLIFSLLPLSLFFTCKQYCEGLMNTKMALMVSLTGNVINVILNYALIYGKLGLPEMGYIGSAWASFYARAFMGISFLILIFYLPVSRDMRGVFTKVKFNVKDFAALWKIGINSAMQFTFEVAAFAIAGFMAGSFGEKHIDAHGIALSIAAFTYMFGSGIGSAATIRVGTFAAQKNWDQIRKAAMAALKLVVLIMGSFGVIFLFTNQFLPRAFTIEAEIVELAAKLLVIAAMFQLFDGIQVTAIGILRGLEDVKVPTLITLVGYWVLALPLAYCLAFKLELQTVGIWIALLSSLVFVSVALFLRFNQLSSRNTNKT
jgi:MATE family multidrug resistance protein